MSFWKRTAARLFSVPYRPDPERRSFLDRAQTRQQDGLAVTVSVLSDEESRRFFGTSMSRRGPRVGLFPSLLAA